MNKKQKLALLATIVGSGVVLLDGTVVNLALPHIGADFHTNFAALQWIADGYLLSLSALILLGGSLGDILGRKKIYIFGLVGFALTSLFCGLAPNATALIGMRILQGVFGALLVPGGLAIINTNFDLKLRGRAIGQWAAWSGIATAIGPFLGGYLIDNFSWRWVFLINPPLIALCLALAYFGIKETKDTTKRHIDYAGAVLASVSLAGITYGLIEGPIKHWSSMTIAAIIGGAIAFGLFLWAEMRSKDPMVHLSLFRSRNFSGSNIATFAMYGALGGFIFAFVIYLQTALHYSSIAAGISLLPITAMLLLFSSRTGALAGKYGPRFFMTAGPLTTAVGMFTLLNLHAGSHYATGMLPGIMLFAIGLVLTVAPLTITVMTSVAESSSGIASGINNAVSRAAGLIVIAVLGILGASHAYRVAIVISGVMAAAAGIMAYFLIQNPKNVAKFKIGKQT